jgi:methyl-accepting chemotaxis protein
MSKVSQRNTKESAPKLNQKSIKVQILLVLLPIVVLAMVLLSFLGYNTSRQIIEEETNRKMELNLSGSVAIIEKSLSQNRKVAEGLARAVQSNETVMTAENYEQLLPLMVGTNPETFGGGVWYEPYKHSAAVEFFSPYSMRENGKIVYVDNYSLGEGVYYTDQDWYNNGKGIKESAVWSAPYYDEFAQISMVTATAPFYNLAGEFTGVATADIDLSNLQESIVALQEKKGDQVFLLDPSGTYIAAEDGEKLLKENITGESNESLATLGKEILNKKSGTGTYKSDGEQYKVWYTKVPETGWIIVFAGARSQLFGSINNLAKVLIILCAALTLLVSGILAVYIQKWLVNPLGDLSRVTSRLAAGDLSVEIEHHLENEIGVVFDSVKKTTERLHDYIDYIDELAFVLNQIGNGNLDYQLELHYVGEFAKLKTSLENIRESMTQTLLAISASAEQVNLESTQVSGESQALAQGATDQAATMEQLSEFAQQISEQSHQNVSRVNRATEYVELAGKGVSESNKYMDLLNDAMKQIGESSQEISKITKLVEGIAYQTNILSLNAAVEAARAGTAGKGFVVVAGEVQKLAAKSAEAAKQTAELINQSTAAITEGERIADATSTLLVSVLEKSKLADEVISDIKNASLEQNGVILEMHSGLSQVSAVVHSNVEAAEKSSASSEELASQAQILREQVGKFKLRK